MSQVIFILDSGSDYVSTSEVAISHPIDIIPLNIHMGDEVYVDGEDLTKDQFYQRMLSSSTLPKTSQPSPQRFYDTYKKHLEEGKTIISISISSDLSGTFQSSSIAREMFSEEEQNKIYLVDSRNVSVTIVHLLRIADQKLLQGEKVEDVVAWLKEYADHVQIYALLDTLENLKKGGRISQAQAFIGGLLNIKPFVLVEHGKVNFLDKFRGRKKGIQRLKEILSNIDEYNTDMLFIAHSFMNEDELRAELDLIPEIQQFKTVIPYKLGSTIGTHAGVNTLGIALIKK